MDSFDIKVLGGNFKVEELLPQEGQTEEEVREHIKTVTQDRWFVLLDDELTEDERDTLAVVDDDFEFQVVAAGQFQGDD